MLIAAKDFKNFKLRVKDGQDIGKAKDFLFDDKYWTIRYLVADTGGWLTGREVLLSPYALEPANVVERVLPVDLTKTQIEGSPSLQSHQPVSRQYESNYYGYYGWPNYGAGMYAWGPYPARTPTCSASSLMTESTTVTGIGIRICAVQRP